MLFPLRGAVGAVVLSLALASCSGEQSSERDAEDQSEATALADDIALLALPGGLQPNSRGAQLIEFGQPQEAVLEQLNAALGEPRREFLSETCEVGPLYIVSYRGNLDVNFEDGVLAGWMVEPSEPTLVATPEGVTTGTPLEQAQDKLTMARTGISVFGAEFSTLVGYTIYSADSGQGQEITAMHAGRVCFRS